MDVKNIVKEIKIESCFCGSLQGDVEGLYHKKIVRSLSVVQALEGSYDIRIDYGAQNSTGEGGVFIAPSNSVQEIVHRNGKSGIMRAQWVFFDVVVNDTYALEDLFLFPIISNKKYDAEIADLIGRMKAPKDGFDKVYASHRLLEILVEQAQVRTLLDPVKVKISQFVGERYADDIKAEDIAKHLYCSTSQVFRYTKKYYGVSPANYVNIIRLAKAENLLLFSEKTVIEIAFLVGFKDSAYFSKLFKKHYGASPQKYRFSQKAKRLR